MTKLSAHSDVQFEAMVQFYLLELLQTFRNVERDVDERPVCLILKNKTSFRLKVQSEDGSNRGNMWRKQSGSRATDQSISVTLIS